MAIMLHAPHPIPTVDNVADPLQKSLQLLLRVILLLLIHDQIFADKPREREVEEPRTIIGRFRWRRAIPNVSASRKQTQALKKLALICGVVESSAQRVQWPC